MRNHEIGHGCHSKNSTLLFETGFSLDPVGHPMGYPWAQVVSESGEEAVQLSGFVGDSSCALAAICSLVSAIY